MSPERPAGNEEQPETRLEEATFAFHRFIVRKAVFEEIPGAPEPKSKSEGPFTGPVTISLSRRIEPNPPRGMVTMGVVVETDPAHQPYRIEVVVSGTFTSQTASVELFDLFCKTTAPTILFPYIRQIVNSLTADGAYGNVRLHPINLAPHLANLQEKRTDLPADETSGST